MNRPIGTKNLKVAELPNGHYRHQLEARVTDPEVADVNVVAVAGTVGDWSCYIGWPLLVQLRPEQQEILNVQHYCKTIRDEEQVMRYGDKVSRVEAEALFPQFAYMAYRE